MDLSVKNDYETFITIKNTELHACPSMSKHTDHIQINPEWFLFSERVTKLILIIVYHCALKQCQVYPQHTSLHVKTDEFLLSHLYALSYLSMTTITSNVYQTVVPLTRCHCSYSVMGRVGSLH